MPELPEVETVCQGLRPVMEGFVIEEVKLNRADLRFPFDPQFQARLETQKIVTLRRRAKFLMAELSSGERLLMHLGMSGRFTINTHVSRNNLSIQRSDVKPEGDDGDNQQAPLTQARHDHVMFKMSSGHQITYNDPRRFGFMELIREDEPSRLDRLGPEPLSNAFNAPALLDVLRSKKGSIKTILLDQTIVAGLGNIYVCEALYKSKISPFKAGSALTQRSTETLVRYIKLVIREAIAAGGSSLRDFAHASGELGYFQHQFEVYGRENEPCHLCQTAILREKQAGRSTFYCPSCQQ